MLDLDALNAVNVVALFIGCVVWLVAGGQQVEVGSMLRRRQSVCVVSCVLGRRQGVGCHLYNKNKVIVIAIHIVLTEQQ